MTRFRDVHAELVEMDGWPKLDAPPSHAQEAGDCVAARAEHALHRAAGRVPVGGSVAVVTHGGLIRALVRDVRPVDWRPENLSVAEFRVTPNVRWEVVDVHDSCS